VQQKSEKNLNYPLFFQNLFGFVAGRDFLGFSPEKLDDPLIY